MRRGEVRSLHRVGDGSSEPESRVIDSLARAFRSAVGAYRDGTSIERHDQVPEIIGDLIAAMLGIGAGPVVGAAARAPLVELAQRSLGTRAGVVKPRTPACSSVAQPQNSTPPPRAWRRLRRRRDLDRPARRPDPLLRPRRVELDIPPGGSRYGRIRSHPGRRPCPSVQSLENQLDDDEKATVVNLIEAILLRHQARRLARSN